MSKEIHGGFSEKENLGKNFLNVVQFVKESLEKNEDQKDFLKNSDFFLKSNY